MLSSKAELGGRARRLSCNLDSGSGVAWRQHPMTYVLAESVEFRSDEGTNFASFRIYWFNPKDVDKNSVLATLELSEPRFCGL